MRLSALQPHELARYGIPPTIGELDRDMSIHRDRLQEALDSAGNTHTPEDVYQMIIHGSAYMFTGKNSVIVAEILQYPLKRVMSFWLAAGDLKELVEMEKSVTDFGKAIGIYDQEFKGRFGWLKIAREHGWKPLHQVWMRDVRS